MPDDAPQPRPEPVATPSPDDLALAMAAALSRGFEGLRLTAYPDPGSGGAPWTIGFGSIRMWGRAVKPGDTCTLAEAEAALLDELRFCLDHIHKHVSVLLSVCQSAALLSFVRNAGTDAFDRSTMLKLLNQGEMAKAADEFPKWVYASGHVMPGLVRRRAMERAVFLDLTKP